MDCLFFRVVCCDQDRLGTGEKQAGTSGGYRIADALPGHSCYHHGKAINRKQVKKCERNEKKLLR
ncbi:MAG: hypothetical protein VB877_14585, partial [Pirellulaceae bacterium]